MCISPTGTAYCNINVKYATPNPIVFAKTAATGECKLQLAEETGVGEEGAFVGEEGAFVGEEGTGVVLTGTDVALAGTDVAFAGTNVVLAGVEVVLAGADVILAEIDVVLDVGLKGGVFSSKMTVHPGTIISALASSTNFSRPMPLQLSVSSIQVGMLPINRLDKMPEAVSLQERPYPGSLITNAPVIA